MNQKTNTIVKLLVFVAFLALCVWAYNTLSKQVRPDKTLQTTASSNSTSTSSNSTSASSTPSSVPVASATESAASLPTSNTGDEEVPAPDFSAYDKEGNKVKLSDYIGKPLVLNFWASWCPPCKAEMPHFNEVYGERGEEIQFLMVDMVDGQRETKDKGEAHIAEQGYSFPVLYDTDQEAAYTYGVVSLPTTYFVDEHGYIEAVAEGQIDMETLLLGISMIEKK